MAVVNSSGKRDAALQSVLAKLEPVDRQVVLDALDAADKTETELRYLADHDPLTALLTAAPSAPGSTPTSTSPPATAAAAR